MRLKKKAPQLGIDNETNRRFLREFYPSAEEVDKQILDSVESNVKFLRERLGASKIKSKRRSI